MTTIIRTIDLNVGDKISFHGALFEISSVRHISCLYRDDMGPDKTTIANGVWLSGNEVPGYFGKNATGRFREITGRRWNAWTTNTPRLRGVNRLSIEKCSLN
ncbi:MAG: hypothetical protein [Bacteriophage sp.]|uniref:hypothetical protein n=1 Tax=Serratia marcescens TaxID=615 RepID=UPI0014370943|nr:hypothetical protein [Serratia marcescens]QHJ76803.1 MAG: hypothetical protein [Bacteriophage sp.]